MKVRLGTCEGFYAERQRFYFVFVNVSSNPVQFSVLSVGSADKVGRTLLFLFCYIQNRLCSFQEYTVSYSGA